MVLFVDIVTSFGTRSEKTHVAGTFSFVRYERDSMPEGMDQIGQHSHAVEKIRRVNEYIKIHKEVIKTVRF